MRGRSSSAFSPCWCRTARACSSSAPTSRRSSRSWKPSKSASASSSSGVDVYVNVKYGIGPSMNAPVARFQPQDPQFAARVRASFGRQKAMALIGASLTLVESGHVEIELPYREDLTQQKGYVH